MDIPSARLYKRVTIALPAHRTVELFKEHPHYVLFKYDNYVVEAQLPSKIMAGSPDERSEIRRIAEEQVKEELASIWGTKIHFDFLALARGSKRREPIVKKHLYYTCDSGKGPDAIELYDPSRGRYANTFTRAEQYARSPANMIHPDFAAMHAAATHITDGKMRGETLDEALERAVAVLSSAQDLRRVKLK